MFIPLAFINRFHQFHGHSISRFNHNGRYGNLSNYEFGDNLFCDIVIFIAIIICIIMVALLIKEFIDDCKNNW